MSKLCYDLGAKRINKKPNNDNMIIEILSDTLVTEGALQIQKELKLIYYNEWSQLNKKTKINVITDILESTIDFMSKNIK
jgi:hypothetical protein